MRYTEKVLKGEAGAINRGILSGYKTDLIGVQGRNNYKAIDHYYIDSKGSLRCQRNIETGTARECVAACYRFSLNNDDKVTTRFQAKALLILLGVDFERDFHEANLFLCGHLVELAHITKYKQPKNANGSLARYFFTHLARQSKYKNVTPQSMHSKNLLCLDHLN